MRKILLVLLIIPVFFLFIIGLVLFDYIYFPLVSYKAEEIAEKHLEEKYNEGFVIEESSFSKPLGDQVGTYEIDSYPVNSPNLPISISVTEDMKPLSDDYLDMKWRAELNKQFGLLYKELFGSLGNYLYMVNVSFPDDTNVKYNISNSYQEIFEKEHNEIGNIIFANVLLSSNDMDYQLEKVFKLLQHLKNQELNYFTLDINYYHENLEKKISNKDKHLDYSEFSNKYFESRDYLFYYSYDSRNEIDRKKLEDIQSSDDLKPYLKGI